VNTEPKSTMDLNFADVVAAEEADSLPGLSAFDRCDAAGCSSQAYVRARLRSGLSLVFCGHHGHDLLPALAGQGAVIRDDTHLLVENRLRITSSLGGGQR
jgi:hypothetical protein